MRVWYVFVHEIQNRVHGDRRHDGDGGGVWRGRFVLGAARDGWGRLDARRHDGGVWRHGTRDVRGRFVGCHLRRRLAPRRRRRGPGLGQRRRGSAPASADLEAREQPGWAERHLGQRAERLGSSGFIQHSTGDGKWDIEDPGTGANLYGVWGSGPTDVYIAPYINTILHSTGDGGWEHEPQAAGTTFQGIWGSGPNDVYAYWGGAIHSDGGGVWQTPAQDIAKNGFQGEPILAMWGSSSTDVYAVGGAMDVYHSKGDGTWGKVFTPAQVPPLGVWGSSATDVYVIARTTVYHSTDGKNWAPQAVPLGDVETLSSVWVLDAHDVYVGTSRARIMRSGGDGRWVADTIDPALMYTTVVRGFWGTSPKNLYVAMDAGIYHGTAP